MKGSIRERLATVDWNAVESSLDEVGWARTPPLLSPPECEALAALWSEPRRFRSRVDMARLRFGVGEYRYFARPLPRLVSELRVHLYSRLAPIAARWIRSLGRGGDFPPTLAEFLELCRASEQTKPTPLLLRYSAGGYNCLHQDLYGSVSFPLQVTCFLSRPEVDYDGGEFLLVEQRPRAQSRGEVVPAEQGALVVFPNAERPVAGARGAYRARVRHGVSRIRRGSRYAVGVIFHDAR